jgi:hypothetical protein
MKKLFIFLLILSIDPLIGQTTSLEINLDPRSIATGESFVASGGLIAADNNPAVLTNLQNISVFYTQRNMDWFGGTGGYFLYALGAAFKTPIGNFGLTYKRFNSGEESISSSDLSVVGRGRSYDHTFILTYAKNITGNLSIGANLKAYTSFITITRGNPSLPETNTPLLVDLGFIYHTNRISKQDFIKDQIRFGASVENFGTDYKQTYHQQETYIELPRFLKLGFAYEIGLPKSDTTNYFKFIFTGQYKYLLNGPESIDSRRDYWGTGFEANFYDILSLRIGGIAYPYTSIYGDKGVFNLRYGLGLALPFQLIGVRLPASLTFDYAVIPMKSISFYSEPKKKNLDAFNFQFNISL